MNAHLIARYRSDLEVALGFLRLKKSIKDMSEIRQARGVYVSTVRLALPFDDARKLISDRFGRFVELRKV